MNDLVSQGPMVPLKVSDDITIYVESLEGEQQISKGDWKEFIEPIEPVVSSIKGMLMRVKPQKATVEFGVQLGLESGKLTSCIVKGSTNANMKIVLEWSSEIEED